MRLVGARSAGGFSTNSMTRPSSVVGTPPPRGGRSSAFTWAVRLEVGEAPLEQGHLGDGQQLLRRREGERTESRPLAAQEDNGLHVVVVVAVVTAWSSPWCVSATATWWPWWPSTPVW